MGYIIIVALICALIGIAISAIIKLIRTQKEMKPFISEAESFLVFKKEAKKTYIGRDVYEYISAKWKMAYDVLILRSHKVRNLAGVTEFLYDYQNLETRINQWNEIFVRSEIEKRADFFLNIDGKALDIQQKNAVVTDEINELVIAGAGSGKTLTIVAKVMYLVKFLGIDPGQILVLAFNRKAAAELTQRLDAAGIPLEAQTFHKLGLGYITEYKKYRPDIAEEDVLRRSVSGFFKRLSKTDKGKLQQVLSFLGIYSYDLRDESEYKTFGDYCEAKMGADLETLRCKYLSNKNLKNKESLRQEKMRSIEETIIANFFFLHGVAYEYEKRYPFQSDDYRKAYHPDFYLPDYDIYLEHFGISEDGQVPWLSEFEAKKYKDDMDWKRKFHKQNGTKLIETYSYWKKDGSLIARLHKLLKDNDIQYKPVNEAEIFHTIYESNTDAVLQEVCKLVSSFLCLYKENGRKDFITLRRDMENEGNPYVHQRTLLFLDMVEPIFLEYEAGLKQAGKIDFADMIRQATEIVEGGFLSSKYRYIIVDEFQDISYGRYAFIKAIGDRAHAKLFCVGDDWQSIYRFFGSDVDFIARFALHFGYSKILKIERTYRFSQQLISVVEPFIMANPSQLKK